MKSLKNSLGLRLLIIGGLSVILLIPSFMIQEIISERETRRDTVAAEISEKWGQEQTIAGPVLTIPYRFYNTNKDETGYVISYAHFLPEKLTINGSLAHELRYRGIYEAILYNSRLSVTGNFSALNPGVLGIPQEDFLLDEAFLSVGISDMTGIKDAIEIMWNDTGYIAEPGIKKADVLNSGISVKPSVKFGRNNSFAFDLNLNGSSGLLFSPIGEETIVKINADWPTPSFSGGFLPVQRTINSEGFQSEWNVLHLNRNFPQQWLGANQDVLAATFGVGLLLPVDEYQKTMRTAKYAIMFIALTFLTFFMIELLSGNIIHPVQYLLIGLALLIFYTLLLSISEYTVFSQAYMIASGAIVLMISVYSYAVLADKLKTAIVFGILTLLYGYLYILLQLQDYALLMGSTGLFFVLSFVMYLTRRIDWFEIMGSSNQTVATQSAKKL